jgi:hypothetical protein
MQRSAFVLADRQMAARIGSVVERERADQDVVSLLFQNLHHQPCTRPMAKIGTNRS